MSKTTVFVRVTLVALLLAGTVGLELAAQQGPIHYIRYQRGSTISYGIKDGETVKELKGDIFTNPQPTGKTYKLADVTPLIPLDPKRVGKIIGIAGNSAAPGKAKPNKHPALFLKLPEQLVGDGSEVPLMPETVGGVIYEAELVVVIGKKARFVSVEDAPKYIFGVAMGHDLQNLGWWLGNGYKDTTPETFLAKNQDAAAGLGTEIVSGLDWHDLSISVKKNGKMINVQRTSQYNTKPEHLVSYLSRYMDLNPGDLLYMACLCTGRDVTHPNQKLFPGDKIEFILENGGHLRQTIVAAKIPPNANTWPDGVQERMESKAVIKLKPLSEDGSDVTPGLEK
jgi:2-keto-4-pentenoate hydratase/2-oxohepta-3-ene-1,7-dioic acid hydratase in catechol pathway